MHETGLPLALCCSGYLCLVVQTCIRKHVWQRLGKSDSEMEIPAVSEERDKRGLGPSESLAEWSERNCLFPF